MNATIDLPTFSLARVLSSAFTRNEHSTLGNEFVGPTPFEIPETAVLEFNGPNQIAISFNYSDCESSEPSDRLALQDGSIIARLGEKTKKILRLQYSGDIEHHVERHFAFDKEVILKSGNASSILTNRMLRSFERNAAIIGSLIAGLPADLFEEIKKQLARMDTASPASTLRYSA